MKKVIVDAYKLERISSLMAKEFGTIPKGEEEFHSFMLHPMESNLLKLHRQNPNRNGRHAIDAIQMALLKIDGISREIDYDYGRFSNPENQAFLHGLLMSFDPYTNSEIQEVVMGSNITFTAKEYYKLPVQCLLRIEKSIIIDSKSQYTQNHSSELLLKVRRMAEFYKNPEDEILKLMIAADLHDIGKLAISNLILDKPGKLDPKIVSDIGIVFSEQLT